jgi:hypothetical protein
MTPVAEIPQTKWSFEQTNAPHPDAVHVTGPAGCVCIMDWCVFSCLPTVELLSL